MNVDLCVTIVLQCWRLGSLAKEIKISDILKAVKGQTQIKLKLQAVMIGPLPCSDAGPTLSHFRIIIIILTFYHEGP